MGIKSEHEIQKQIQLNLSANQCTVFRANVGKVLMKDGRWFDTGLPKGFPDLVGFRWIDNQIFFIEVKSATGKPRPEQIRFHNMLQKRKIVHGIARSADDALKIVKEGLVGYGY
ncbi:VRR-NUC domain-containing protein [Lactobacillus sp. ESL0230]|uniref:VRR-NUC domain-containing protein n=1 Tax=Lactobacillus sp. ESL0230 TaxID=2069353 RepID=UPI000EFCE372|nr:VRR-NUC domain-containing protein [Lactobacillus sp. ESL0230]RMC46528.1 VRR-NUC domain-containing protein [Lactobacillus sp. ESL0230]